MTAIVREVAVAYVVIASVAFAFAKQFQTSAALCTEAVVAVVTRGRACAVVTCETSVAKQFQTSAAVQAAAIYAIVHRRAGAFRACSAFVLACRFHAAFAVFAYSVITITVVRDACAFPVATIAFTAAQ